MYTLVYIHVIHFLYNFPKYLSLSEYSELRFAGYNAGCADCWYASHIHLLL